MHYSSSCLPTYLPYLNTCRYLTYPLSNVVGLASTHLSYPIGLQPTVPTLFCSPAADPEFQPLRSPSLQKESGQSGVGKIAWLLGTLTVYFSTYAWDLVALSPSYAIGPLGWRSVFAIVPAEESEAAPKPVHPSCCIILLTNQAVSQNQSRNL